MFVSLLSCLNRGLAADEIASHFSDVHALIRVDLIPATNASASEAPTYAVSCYDHFAVSSSSSSTSRSLSGSTSNDDGNSSSSSGSAGVWLLGMTGGVRAAPQPLEFNKPDGPLRGRLKHGDSLMIASQQHGGGGGYVLISKNFSFHSPLTTLNVSLIKYYSSSFSS